MIKLFKRLFKREHMERPASFEAEPSPVEHALILTVVPAPDSVAEMDMLEDRLRAALGNPAIGEVDGHEIEVSGRDALIYMYGPDAKALFDAVEPVIAGTPWITQTSVYARFGDVKDKAAPVARFILGKEAVWP